MQRTKFGFSHDGSFEGLGLLVDLPSKAAGNTSVFDTAEGSTAWWGAFDIRYPATAGFPMRMSNPKLHQESMFASGPLNLTFAKVPASPGRQMLELHH
jgi:hypothetical protein